MQLINFSLKPLFYSFWFNIKLRSSRIEIKKFWSAIDYSAVNGEELDHDNNFIKKTQ